MKEAYTQVEGHSDLVRDNSSHAIINRNVSAYEQENVLQLHKNKEMKYEIRQER